ncbi:hypothetical protein LEM8419_00253 [Neolewinella maritima]|uniref:protein-tyrosine-phosphatase n=1 Tax=Neolewinella maritima TaxID=1383882 RepID=A0ABM9AWV1_9BACT|nr:CpsB/CapC family capsule biosynthesis tyrosine phosphatase [Neolewinella maritima]CAH0998958.1 hypothetical protein LEM8419_00253 [Neolewinella maritima]
MFEFLRRGKSLDGLGFLQADMHAHWLPGIDDGAATLNDSVAIIRDLVDLGYQQLYATPHVMADLYPNSSATILAALETVREAAQNQGITVPLGTAAEYLLDEGFLQRLEQDDLLTLPGNYLLVEMSFVSAPPDVHELFFKMQMKGYRPILAHPERYRYYHTTFDQYRFLHERGALFQVNLLSLNGHYGKSVQQIAWKLVDEGLVSMFGTDAHHRAHTKELRQLLGNRRFAALSKQQDWLNHHLIK